MKKFSPVLLTALAGMSMITHAYAGDIPLGCMSKDKLQALFKADNQAFVEQFERTTDKGVTRTSITSQKEGKSFKDGGYGYIVDAQGGDGCVVAKTRFNVSGEKQVEVATVHELGGQIRTSAEWKQMGEWLTNNRAKAKSDIMSRGVSAEDAEVEIQAIESMGQYGAKPGELSALVKYNVSQDGYKAVSRRGLN